MTPAQAKQAVKDLTAFIESLEDGIAKRAAFIKAQDLLWWLKLAIKGEKPVYAEPERNRADAD